METVRICDKAIPVVPQRHARLRHRLNGQDLNKLIGREYASESYRLLSILIPALPGEIPLWQWEGYGSQEAMDAGEYVEADDRSPTTDAIAEAFEKALKVNAVGRLGKLLSTIQSVQQMGESAQAMAATEGAADPSSPS